MVWEKGCTEGEVEMKMKTLYLVLFISAVGIVGLAYSSTLGQDKFREMVSLLSIALVVNGMAGVIYFMSFPCAHRSGRRLK
jgi:hypothetical protein